MDGLLLFEFVPENELQTKETGIWERLSERIRRIFKKEKEEDLVEAVEVFEGVIVHRARVPFSISQYLEGNRECGSVLGKILEGRQWGIPFMPRLVPEDKLPAGAFKCDGKLLFKAMMVSIIQSIFGENGIKIGDLDITIIQGTDRKELYSCINVLSPLVRYLTVTGNEVSSMESDVDRICSETGLSIGLVSDPRRAVRKADIVINLGDLGALVGAARINSGAVMLNYGNALRSAQIWEGALVNGMETRLPVSAGSRLGGNIIKAYGSTQLAELLVLQSLKLGMDTDANDNRTLEQIRSEYVNKGCSISGFAGRHSIMGIRDIRPRRISHPEG